jgi:type II secretory pathway pseudopilin PulG
MTAHTHPVPHAERGTSLAELMVALVILSIGILAVAQLFPAGTREQNKDRMMTAANYYAQEKLERLSALPWTHPDLGLGVHPAGGVKENLGPTGAWKRSYDVTLMQSPLDNLKKIAVTVTWGKGANIKSVTATTYLRR